VTTSCKRTETSCTVSDAYKNQYGQNLTSLCLDSSTCCQHMALHAFAAERCAVAPLLLGACSPPLSISCLHAAHQQTRCMPLLPSNDEKKTTYVTRPLHRPCSTYYVNNEYKITTNVHKLTQVTQSPRQKNTTFCPKLC